MAIMFHQKKDNTRLIVAGMLTSAVVGAVVGASAAYLSNEQNRKRLSKDLKKFQKKNTKLLVEKLDNISGPKAKKR